MKFEHIFDLYGGFFLSSQMSFKSMLSHNQVVHGLNTRESMAQHHGCWNQGGGAEL